MSARGRGRGRGSTRSFNREQLNALGATGPNTEPQQKRNLEPPPLFPPSHKIPVTFDSSKTSDYEIVLRNSFVKHLQSTYSYMNMPEQSNDDSEKIRLPAPKKMTYDWHLLPSELRPKLKAKRQIKALKKEDNDSFLAKLGNLEKMESNSWSEEVKTEPKVEEDEDDEMEQGDEDMEEEIEDGDDYGNNYFDNGEDYCNDEDDNLDDGAVY